MLRKTIYLIPVLIATAIYIILNDDLIYQNALVKDKRWETGAFQEEVLTDILKQSFSYLGEGGQMVAFQSDDGQYVLKLFKFKNLAPSIWISYLPPVFPFKDFKKNHTERRSARGEAAFLGHLLASLHSRKESGIVYLQLNPTPLSKPVFLRDKWGISRCIHLEKTAFLVQKKGRLLSEVMKEHFSKREFEKVNFWVDKLLALYLLEYQKGICDSDHGIMHNIGCIGDELLHLDVGGFIEKSMQGDIFRNELIKVTRKLRQWTEKNFPEDVDLITKMVDEKLTQILKERDIERSYAAPS